MIYVPLRISTDVNITVTNTATKLYTLIDTASGEPNSMTYYDDANANAIMISAEDGDIRYLVGTDPTATDGTLISSGTTWYIPGIELNELRLIRAGGTDVTVTAVPYMSEQGESPCMLASDVTVEAPTDIRIKDGDGTDLADVDWDGTYNALATTDGRMVFDVDDNGIAASQIPQTTNDLNYGYSTTDGYWTRFLTELDDGTIETGLKPQLVNGLMYYYEDKANAWRRWEGEGGSMWTTVYGMYTATGDSILNDTLDTIKVSNDTAVNLKVDGSDVTQPVSATDLDIRDLTSGTDSVSAVQSGTWDIGTITNDVNVTATDLDIRDLTSVSDSVAVTTVKPDGTNTMPSGDTDARSIYVNLGTNNDITGTVTANAGTNLNTSALALDATLTDKTQLTKITDGTDEVGIHDEMIQTVDSGHLISMGLISGHECWSKIGYNASITNSEEVVWAGGGNYAFPKGAGGLEVVSSDNTHDIGTVIHSGTSTGGSTTTLTDTGADFTAGTPVAVFDTVILDKDGANPEFGIVTGVTANTLTIAGGFSNGGSGDSRDYEVIDYNAYTGCHAVLISYLDDDFVQHKEIVVLNGTTSVATSNTDYYRINDMFVIASGSATSCVGNVDIRDLADTPIYSRIEAGYTRARSAVFTVKSGLVLYIKAWNIAWSAPNDSKVQSARFYLEANNLPSGFNTGSVFYPFAETMVTNEDVNIGFDCPLRFEAGTDIIIKGLSVNAAGDGPATTVLRGWIETT